MMQVGGCEMSESSRKGLSSVKCSFHLHNDEISSWSVTAAACCECVATCFFHIEQHMEESPAAYIQWHFKDVYDKEKTQIVSFRISEMEQRAIDDFGLEAMWSRCLCAGKVEYDVKKKNVPEHDDKYYNKDELLSM
eukprot:3361568-Ditylum_brightwellii.AAC.2